MPRTISEFGPEPPEINDLTQTLGLDFTHDSSKEYGGLDTELFKLDAYPWLWLAEPDANATEDVSVGRYVLDMQVPHSGTTKLKVQPAEVGTQLIINRESQYYVRRHEQRDPANNIPPLVYHGEDDALHIRTIRTPVEFEDKALGNMDAYEIVSINQATRVVRVRGLRYDRKEPSDDGSYSADTFYMGVNRFLRDTLNSDTGPDLNLSWQFKKYDYAHAKFEQTGERVTYDQIVDETTPDPVANNQTTFHNIRLQNAPAQWPDVGSQIKLFRRMPFCSGMVTTNSTFAQKYFMVEYETELSESFWQFFAIFGWSNYIETINGINFSTSNKDAEIDLIENPSGDRRWRFHNAHAPQNPNLNMAVNEGRTPVMGNPEWDNNNNQQHQLTEQLAADYTGRVTFRFYWWPENNSYGKPGNSLEWYLQDTDGKFKRIGGCLAPAAWNNGIIDHKQFFFNGGAYGDFIRGLNFVYGGGPTSAPKIDDFVSKIYKFDVYQFPGEELGGAGIPNVNGGYPNGLQTVPSINGAGNAGGGSSGSGSSGTGTTDTSSSRVTRDLPWMELPTAYVKDKMFRWVGHAPEGEDDDDYTYQWAHDFGAKVSDMSPLNQRIVTGRMTEDIPVGTNAFHNITCDAKKIT